MKTVKETINDTQVVALLNKSKKAWDEAEAAKSQSAIQDKLERDQLKDSLAQQVLTIIVTIFRSEDQRLADEDTFVLAKNLFKNEFKGLTESQIRYGMTRISGCKWPPTPYDFRKLCEPNVEDIGMMSLDDTFRELQLRVTDKSRTLSRPNAWIFQHVDTWLLMDGERQKQAKAQVAHFYAVCRDRILNKEPLDLTAPKVLENQSNCPEPVSHSAVIEAMTKLGLSKCKDAFKDRLRKNT